MVSIRIGGVIYCNIDNWEIIKLNNTTEIPFITGMQPVLNILWTHGKYPEEPLSAQSVDYYNRRVVEHSEGRIMGNSENIVRRYI